jgi:hypothetical protein
MDIWNAILSLFTSAHGLRFYACLSVPALFALTVHLMGGWTNTTLSVCAFLILAFSVIGVVWQHHHETHE